MNLNSIGMGGNTMGNRVETISLEQTVKVKKLLLMMMVIVIAMINYDYVIDINHDEYNKVDIVMNKRESTGQSPTQKSIKYSY